MIDIPKIPLGEGIDAALEVLTDLLSGLTRAFSDAVELGIDAIVSTLGLVPPVLLILIFAAIAWRVAGWRVGLFTLIGLAFIWNLDLWEPTDRKSVV